MKKSLISLVFLLFIASVQGKILMKPYLQAVTANSIYVMVECDSRDTVTVKFGISPSYGSTAETELIAATSADQVTYVHKVKLAGLSADTKYYYQAVQGNSVSDQSGFHTAVGSGTKFRFTWMADCRSGTAVHDSIAELLLKAGSLFSLYGGDLCLNSSYPSWKNEFFRAKQLDLISRVPFFNSPGNHEGWETNARAFLQNPSSPSGTQDYYSFDYGDLHVLCLNYEIPYDKESPQYRFAQADLSSTEKAWNIVYCHSPAYCSGGHGEDKEMIEMTKSIFEPNHVDLVLGGHTHFYQHNLVNGIHHFVIGSAGAPLYNPKNAYYTLVSAKDYNYAVFDVSPDTLILNVYNASNKKLDSLQLTKGSKQ